MDIFNQFAADPNKELTGVWITIGGTEAKPVKIKVARSGNKRHGKVITQLYEANKSTLDLKNDAADAKGEEITVEAMAKGILLGWKGVSFKGTALPDAGDETDKVSAEDRLADAKTLLGVKDFRELVTKHSLDFQRFKAVQDEVDAGN